MLETFVSSFVKQVSVDTPGKQAEDALSARLASVGRSVNGTPWKSAWAFTWRTSVPPCARVMWTGIPGTMRC